jgi:hypothetical protein
MDMDTEKWWTRGSMSTRPKKHYLEKAEIKSLKMVKMKIIKINTWIVILFI